MATNYEALLYTLTEFANVFNDFFNGDPTDVTFKYMDQNGKVQTKQVPNVAKVKQELAKVAVSEDDLNKKLQDYYTKIEVNSIRDQIVKMFDNYYKKNEVNDLIRVNRTAVEQKVSANTNLINKTKAELITDTKNATTKSRIMTKAEYEALRKERLISYAGSGVIEGRPTKYEDGSENFGILHPHFSSRKYWLIYRRKETSYLNGLAIGDDENQKFKPTFIVSGHRIVITSTGNGTGSIKFPEAPTAKAIVKDSKKLPVDLEQGDFIVLKDLNRELVNNGTFNNGIEGWSLANTSNYHGKQEYDSTNKRIKITVDKDAKLVRTASPIYLIKGVKYRLTFSIQDKTSNAEVEFKIGTTPGKREVFWNRYLDNGDVETEFIANRGGKLYITLEVDGSNASAYYDNISVKQVEEQPVVALENIAANEDVYTSASLLEARPTISRKDLLFIEAWEEDIAEKDVFYPYGNVQYRSGNVDGIGGIAEANWFNGHDTYSRFGTWQKPNALVGKGYRWSKLTEEQRRILASNPDHNVYLDGDRWVQVRYRFRVVKGLGDDWSGVQHIFDGTSSRRKWLAYTYSTYTGLFAKGKYTKLTCDIDNNRRIAGVTGRTGEAAYFYNGVSKENCIPNMKGVGHSCTFHTTAMPLALVQRRNDGIFNKVFNPTGTARGYNKQANKLLEFSEYAVDDTYIKSLEDCFNLSKIAAVTSDNNIVPADDSAAKYRSGYTLSALSGHEAGLFYDRIDARDVTDLRMSAKKINPDDLIADDNLVLLNSLRGKEKPVQLDAVYTVDLNYIVNGSGYYIRINNSGSFNFIYRSKEAYSSLRTSNKNWLSCLLYNDTRGYLILEHPEVGIEAFKTVYAGNYYIGVDYTEDKSRLAKFTNKKNVKVYIFTNKFTKYTNNKTTSVTEIAGDPRKLQDRTKLSVISTNQEVSIDHNEYVYCSDNTHNKGNKGHYYRLLKGPFKSINTNDDSKGTANTEGGHIDFSDSTVWLDLGNKGTVGGYPDSWLKYGFQGQPALVDENGVSLLPITGAHETGWGNPILKGFYFDGDHIGFRLSRPMSEVKRITVRTKNGEFKEYQPRCWGREFGAETGRCNWSGHPSNSTSNMILFNVNNTYSDLGYASAEEMLDLLVITVTYNTKADVLRTLPSTNGYINNKSLSTRTDVHLNKLYGTSIVEEMIRKVPKGKYGDTSVAVITNASLENCENNHIAASSHCENPNSYKVPHTPINFRNFGWDTFDAAVKFIPFITGYKEALQLNYIYKELKYNATPKVTLTPGIILENKAINKTKYLGGRKRSYTVAHFEDTGKLIGIESFDVYGDGEFKWNGTKENSGVEAFKKYLTNIPVGHIVAISTWDEPRNNVAGNDDVIALLKSVGATEDVIKNLEYRSSYALIGIKTGQPQGTTLVEAYRGKGDAGVRVEYAINDDIVIRVDSAGKNSNLVLPGAATWGDDDAFNLACGSIRHVLNENGEKVIVGQMNVQLPYYSN